MLRRLYFDLSYLFHPPWDSGISPPELLEFLATHSPGRAVDLGCGSGTNTITLAQHGWTVTGIDFAPRAIRIARHRARVAKVEATFVLGDVTQLHRLTGPFDLGLDLGCFHGIENRQAYLSELGSALRAGAFWLLYAFFKGATDQPGPGLEPSVLQLIQRHGFNLISRQDGIDKRNRPSAWFLYQRGP